MVQFTHISMPHGYFIVLFLVWLSLTGHRVMHFSRCKYTIAITFRNFGKTKTMQVTVTKSPRILWDCFSKVSGQLLLLKTSSPNIFICILSNIRMSQRMYMCLCLCIGVYIFARITLELKSSINIYTKHKLYTFIFFFFFVFVFADSE